MPTCPYCHIRITEDVDTINIEICDEKIYLYYVGNCCKCHRAFKWRENYMLTDYADEFEEITP